MESRIVTHDFPAWREKADFIIASRLGEELGIDRSFDWEQLWGRKISDNTFELCCVPFFTYDLALGDIVETKPFESRNFVVHNLVSGGGHKTFRLFFQVLDRWNEILDDIRDIGCIVEPRWEKSKLVAIDACREEESSALIDYLKTFDQELLWENGN
ncbi:MAG TPA: DUF4265 domain-containing protein [Pyrinomonadaceae bacterium]|nr:DUF4265 domain-containing protein [Pyrinomonadaceae bacterium]